MLFVTIEQAWKMPQCATATTSQTRCCRILLVLVTILGQVSGALRCSLKTLVILVGGTLLLTGCSTDEQHGSLSPQPARNMALEEQAARNLLALYRTAILQEDIDRLQDLVQQGGAATQPQTCPAGPVLMAAPEFLASMTVCFRRQAFTALEITNVTMQLVSPPFTVHFQETVSFEALDDANAPEQRTLHRQTTFELVDAPEEKSDVVTVRIATVRYDGPLIRIVIPGQVVATQPARIFITETTGHWPLVGGTFAVCETDERQSLMVTDGLLYGFFTPPEDTAPTPLCLRLRSATGDTLSVMHRYRLRHPRDGVVQRFPAPETQGLRLSALTIASDDAVWVGGTAQEPQSLGSVIRVRQSDTTVFAPTDEAFSMTGRGRVIDLAIDTRERLQVLFVDETILGAIVGNGTVVFDPQTPELFCRTVNFVDNAYPLQDSRGRRSASTRLRAAQAGKVWLYGSDGGLTRVTDKFRQGNCPGTAAAQYDRTFRRDQEPIGVLSNTIPAFVEAREGGALWFGTALGVTRFQQGGFTPVPFDPGLSFEGNVETLEAFFQAVARAIFEARPLTSVALDGVSFVDEFDAPVVKADLSFSMLEDHLGQIWVGTLGGGLRRIDAPQAMPQDTLHLTRLDGLSSNIIFALTEEELDDSLWMATDKGVSRLQVDGESFVIATFSTLDGLPTLPGGLAQPISDIGVDSQGQAWLATDNGLFRILPAGGQVRGRVLAADGTAVAGADILVVDTPWRTVTDAAGRFVLALLPPGRYTLQVDARLALGDPVLAQATVTVVAGEQANMNFQLGEDQLVPSSVARPEGDVTRPLDEPLVVTIRDASNNPLVAVPITFTITIGTGTLSAMETVSNASGQAETELTFGMQAGVVVVTATAQPRPAVSLSTTFMLTAHPDRSTVRLIRVAGNNQSVPPGQALPRPLILRLEDQFGNRLDDEPVMAAILEQRVGALVAVPVPEQASAPVCTRAIFTDVSSVSMTTDSQGEVAFCLRPGGESDQDVIVEGTAPNLGQVQAVQFVTIVGTLDIDDIPLDIATGDGVVYIAAGFSGLQVINVADPTQPRFEPSVALDGVTLNVAVAGNMAYVTTSTPTAFHILDLSNPRLPVPRSCLKAADGEGAANCTCNSADGTTDAEDTAICLVSPDLSPTARAVRIVLQDNVAYVAFTDRDAPANTTLLTVDDPDTPSVTASVQLADQPHGVAVVGDIAYVPVGAAGLQIIDVGDVRNPRTVSDAALPALRAFSGLASAGSMLYLIDSPDNGLQFRILDVSVPTMPVLRGSQSLPAVALPATASTIAVADDFAYVASLDLGLQVFAVHDPDAPRFVGSVATPSVAFNAATTSNAERTFIHVTDPAVGLNVVAGPPRAAEDRDSDGVIDFFDAFPADASEALDSDQDGIGNNADTDDDNDGFSDAEELQQRTDALNPRVFPVPAPVFEANNTLLVDAGAIDRRGNGSLAAPYGSISAALRAIDSLRNAGFAEPVTIEIRAGTYSALDTGEIFPLFFNRRGVTLRGDNTTTTRIDAAFFADVVDIVTTGIHLENVTLARGINGLVANLPDESAPSLILRHIQAQDSLFSGIAIGGGGSQDAVEITDTRMIANGFRGLQLFDGTRALLRNNTIQDNGAEGVILFDAHADLDGNTISNNGQCGVCVAAAGASLLNNNIQANHLEGIRLTDDSSADLIRGNTIINNTTSGVVVQRDSTATLLANTIADNGTTTFDHGVLVASGAFADIRNNNMIARNTGAGVLVAGTETARSRALVTDNRLVGNVLGVNVLRHASAEIIGNTIRDSRPLHGVWLNNADATLVRGNQIVGSAENGILLQAGAVATLINNVIERNDGDGIRLISGSTATIQEGTISTNGADGIHLADNITASIALSGAPITISFNTDDGIDIPGPGARVEINLDNIVFIGNGDEDIVEP